MTKKALAALPVIALALGVGGFFALRIRARQAGERLVVRAVELGARTFQRAPHLSGAPDETLAAVLKGKSPDKEWTEACSAVARGDEPLEKLAEPCRAAFERDVAWATRALMTSRAQRWSRHPDDVTVALIYAARLAALEVRGRPAGEGAPLCLDVVATARDRALGGGVIGMAIAAGMVHEVVKPCTAALEAASPEQQQALVGIVAAWPKEGDWVPYELLNLAGAFYPVLSGEQLQRIPTGLRVTVAEGDITFFERVVLMQALPGVVAMFERLEQLSTLEPAKRDAELAALEAAEADSWNPIRRLAAPSFGKFFARDDRCRQELRALLGAL